MSSGKDSARGSAGLSSSPSSTVPGLSNVIRGDYGSRPPQGPGKAETKKADPSSIVENTSVPDAMFQISDMASAMKKLVDLEKATTKAMIRRSTEHEHMQERIDALQSSLDNRAIQVKTLADELFMAKQKFKEMKLDLTGKKTLGEIAETVVSENQKLKAELEDREKRLVEMETSMASFRGSTPPSEEDPKAKEVLETKIRKMDTAINNLKSENESLKAKGAENKRTLNAKEKQLVVYRQSTRLGVLKFAEILNLKEVSEEIEKEENDENLTSQFLEIVTRLKESYLHMEDKLNSNFTGGPQNEKFEKKIKSLERTISDLEVSASELKRTKTNLSALKEALRGSKKKEETLASINDGELASLLEGFEKRLENRALEYEGKTAALRETIKSQQSTMMAIRKHLRYYLMVLKEEPHKASPEDEEPIGEPEMDEFWQTLDDLHDAHADELESRMTDVALLTNEVEHLSSIMVQKMAVIEEKNDEIDLKNEQIHELQKRVRGSIRLLCDERAVFDKLLVVCSEAQKEIQARENRVKKIKKDRDKKDEERQGRQMKRFESEDLEHSSLSLANERLAALRAEGIRPKHPGDASVSMYEASVFLHKQLEILQHKAEFTDNVVRLREHSHSLLGDELRATLDLCGVYQDLARVYRENTKTASDALVAIVGNLSEGSTRKLHEIVSEDDIPLIMTTLVSQHQVRPSSAIPSTSMPSVQTQGVGDVQWPLLETGADGAVSSPIAPPSLSSAPSSNLENKDGSPSTPSPNSGSSSSASSQPTPQPSSQPNVGWRGNSRLSVSPKTPSEAEPVTLVGTFLEDVSAAVGSSSSSSAVTYDWSKCEEKSNSFTPIPKAANKAAYTPVLDDVGCVLMCTVKVNNVVLSTTSNPVVQGNPTFTTIKASGGPTHTHTISINATYRGGVQGKSIIQWFRSPAGRAAGGGGKESFRPIPGATSRKYHPSVDDLNCSLMVQLTPVRNDDVKGASRVVHVNEDFLKLDERVKESAENATPDGVFQIKVLEKRANQKDKFRLLTATPRSIQIKGMGSRVKAKIPYDNSVSIHVPASSSVSPRFDVVTSKYTFHLSCENVVDRDVAVLTLRRLMDIALSK